MGNNPNPCANLLTTREQMFAHPAWRKNQGWDEHDMTPLQHQILGLTARGLTMGQVGVRLHLSPNSVRKILARLRDKLGADDTPHLLRLARERGILPTGEAA